MAFDVQGALKAGYSSSEIADFLASQNKFDISGARSAGYSDDEILSHLGVSAPSTDRIPDNVPEMRAYEPTMLERISEFFGGANKDRASNEVAARQIAKEQGISIDEVYRQAGGSRPLFNPEGRATPTAAVEAAGVVANEIPKIPAAAANTVLRAIRGGDIEVGRDSFLDRMIDATEGEQLQYVDPNYEAFNNLGKSFGYSLSTLVSSALAGAGATAVSGPVGGVTAATGTSLAVSYRASKDEFVERVREKLDEDSKKVFGQPLSQEQWNRAKQEFEEAAMKYGAWEAIPETVSNLIFLRPFAAPIKAAGAARVKEFSDRALQAIATGYVPENITETATALGQNAAEREARLTDESLTVQDAFKQQFIPTLFLTGTTAGTAAGARAGAEVYQEQILPRVSPERAFASALDADIAATQLTPRTPTIEEDRNQRLFQAQQALRTAPDVATAAAAAEQIAGSVDELVADTERALVADRLATDRLSQFEAGVSGSVQSGPAVNLEQQTARAQTLPSPAAQTPATPTAMADAINLQTEQQFGLDRLRMAPIATQTGAKETSELFGQTSEAPSIQAPRPQRIAGSPTASLNDQQLQEITQDETASPIARRGAFIELEARKLESQTAQGAQRVESVPIPESTLPAPGRIEPTPIPESVVPAAAPGRIEPTPIPESVQPAPSAERIEPTAIPESDASPAAQADPTFFTIDTALPNTGAAPVGGVAAAESARQAAQSAVDQWAAANGIESPAVLNPAPETFESNINEIAQLVNTQLSGKVYAYYDERPQAMNGFAVGGVAFVNTANPDFNVAETSLHEFKHTVEQIAKAEQGQGLTNTPAQQFVAQIDSVYDDMTEAGKRAYLENFLAKDELGTIADPAAREARIQELLADPLTRSEMTADFLGNRATDKRFWQSLAEADPEGFKGFVEKWLQVIDNIIARLRGSRSKAGNESKLVDTYVRDLNKAKMVAREALLQYSKAARQVVTPGVTTATESVTNATPTASARQDQTRDPNASGVGYNVSRTNIGDQNERDNDATGDRGVSTDAVADGRESVRDGRSEIPSYGQPREGAVSVVGRHYSNAGRKTLNGNAYGRGARGAEAGRLADTPDPRLRQRIYFYVDAGNGIRPEAGVGGIAHEVRLDNIYDPVSALIPPQPNPNAFESAVINAGFDGYVVPFGNQKAAVLLGPRHTAVPVARVDAVAPAASKRQYKLDIDREERETAKAAGLTAEEQGAMLRDAQANNIPESRLRELFAEARETKKRYPRAAGWLPLKVLGLEIDKNTGEASVKYKKEAYAYNRPIGTTRAPAKMDKAWATRVGNEFETLVLDIYRRAEAGDKNAQIIIGHQTWYRNVAAVLRAQYGAFGDLLADLLGATSPNTPVDTNWRFSIDVMQRFVRGDFNKELEKFDRYVKGGNAVSKYPSADKIKQITGKLYGMNSGNAMVALLDMWRAIEPGSAPKARNFALNLIGQSGMATIDVWAARMLRRAADLVRGNDLPRIPPPAEQGVSGTWNADATAVTGEFGFGAAVMEDVSKRLQERGYDVTAPDLQAIAWFAEKELWGQKGWTTKTGEGGSFEENIEQMPVQRFVGGISIQQGEAAPQAENVSLAQARLMSMLSGDDSVIAARAMPTRGLYAGVVEESFDVEIAAKAGEFDPSMLLAEMARLAQEFPQYDFFLSEALAPAQDSPNARPGIELYFKSKKDLESVMPVLEAFTSRGQDGFTLAVDPRAQEGEFIGVRLQYVPEISMRWDADLRERLQRPGELEREIQAKFEALNDVAADLANNDSIAYSSVVRYDTLVIGKEDYDALIDRIAAGRDREAGEEAWFGQPVRTHVERAAARLEGDAGQGRQTGVSRTGADVREARREVTGEVASDVASTDDSATNLQASRRQRTSPFYSQLAKAIDEVPARLETQPAAQWKAWLASNASKLGIKKEEIEWTGINEYLDLRGKDKVNKAEIGEYLKANGVQVEEVKLEDFVGKYLVYEDGSPITNELFDTEAEAERWIEIQVEANLEGDFGNVDEVEEERSRYEVGSVDEADLDAESGAVRYRQYQLPGGTNYKELLLTLPERKPPEREPQNLNDIAQQMFGKQFSDLGDSEANQVVLAEKSQKSSQNFRSRHWNQSNILAHVRFNERTDADGNRVLFIEEMQSDWAQEGRKKGFQKTLTDAQKNRVAELNLIADERDFTQAEQAEYDALRPGFTFNTMPAAPFVQDTKGWLALATKRMIAYAVDNGFDKVAFINGQQSADRYNLAKVVDYIEYEQTDPGKYYIRLTDRQGGRPVTEYQQTPEQLEDIIGKELTQQILAGEGEKGDDGNTLLRAKDFKIGGKGMIKFYDQIVPQVVNDVLKKVGGGKLETLDLGRTKSTDTSVQGRPNPFMSEQDIGEPIDGRVTVTNNETGESRVFETRQQAREYMAEYLGKNTDLSQLGFTITEPMKAKVEQGLPLFSQRQPQRNTDGWILSRDAAGRFRFGAGAKAYRLVANIANNVLDKVGMKPISTELSRAMRGMKVEVKKAQELTAEVADKLKELSDDERQMISDVIEGELKAGINPPKRVLELAASMQSIMTEQSEELVRLGMLSPDAANRWDGKYLPRFYEQKIGDDVKAWARAAKSLLGKAKVMQGVKGDSLKSRGLFRTVPLDELQDWIDQGWEQRDPDFDPVADTETVVWRDYTRKERESMGEIRDAMFRFVMGYTKSQRDIALGRLYEKLNDTVAKRGPEEGYVKVPGTMIEGTNVKRYGKLANKWVPKEVLDHLSAYDTSMQNDLVKMYLKGLSMWKEGKTVLNPVAHANNTLSNLTMAHFAGVSYWEANKYAAAVRDFMRDAPMMKEAKEAGLFGGTFNQSELMNQMPPQLKALAGMSESRLKKGVDLVWNALSFGLRKPAAKMYEFEDLFFRYLIYRDARTRGMDPQDAVDYSQQYIFTYDDLPKGARIVRDVALPFFAYTYKVVPPLARTALEYPWRFATPAALLYAVNAMMYAMAAGDDDEDWASVLRRYLSDPDFRKQAKEIEGWERENLPEWMKGYSFSLGTPKAIRLGMDDVTGLPMFMDVMRMFPGGDLLDANANAGGVPLLQPITPSSPILNTVGAMLWNKDPFFGRDIVDKTDTSTEAAAKRAKWLYQQFAPAVAIGNHHWDRAMNVIANVSGQEVMGYTGIGKDGLPVQPGLATIQTFGLKVRPIDLDLSEQINASQQRALIRDLDSKIRQINRLESKGAIGGEAADREREKLIEKKSNLREGLTLEGYER